MMILNSFQDDLTSFLRNYGLYICLAIILLILLTILFIYVIPYLKKRKETKLSVPQRSGRDWLNALGGKDNIYDLLANGSRLSLRVKDPQLIDQAKLKEYGVTSIITMSSKVILVIENKANKIKDELEKSL
ncbi:MAG: PTS transporter subunit EIIB [Bacilli bacterium]